MATVSQSDNNGCDLLFRLMGGTSVVNQFIHALGVTGIAIVATEEEMHRDWKVQYGNFSTPAAMTQLLRKFYRGEVLAAPTTAYLRGLMEATTTGPKRLKGRLPKHAIVAHKTGSSGANDDGITAALNDVGVMTLPGGKHVAIAVFVSETPADDAASEEVIAKIARAVWDDFERVQR
jgi:beta-lactamase class A